MADYYVVPPGTPGNTPTSPYDTPEKAANSVATILGLALTGSNNLYIEGILTASSNYIALTAAKHSNLTINFAKDSVISPLGEHCMYVAAGVTDIMINDGTLRQTVAAKKGLYVNGGVRVKSNNLTIESAVGHDNDCLQINGDTDFEHNNLTIRHGSTVGYPVALFGAAAGTFNNVISVAAGHSTRTNFWSVVSTGIVNINNSIITDSNSHGVYQNNATGTVNLNNSIVQGGANAAYTRNAGTLNESNNLFIAPWLAPTSIVSGFTPNATSIITKLPKFNRLARGGFIVPCIDDAGNFSYVKEMETLLNLYGMKGTYYIQRYKTYYSRPIDNGWLDTDTIDLKNMVANGVIEAGIHTTSHSDMTLANGATIFTLTTGTITVNRATETISFSGGGSVMAFKSKTLYAIRAELIALGATITNGLYRDTETATATIASIAFGECIADTTASTTINLLVNADATEGYYKSEMVDAKDWLTQVIGGTIDGQTNLPYACKSFGYPYNAMNATSRSATVNAGFNNARGNLSSTSFVFLVNADRFVEYVIGSGNLIGADEATTRQKARSIGYAVAQSGIVLFALSHSNSEVSTTHWGYIFDEWSKINNLIVTSANLMAQTIMQSPWVDTGETSTRVYTEDGDYHLQPASPCLGAGVSIPAIHEQATPATDRDNKTIHFLPPSIGPYDGQGDTKAVTADFTPTGYSVRGTEASPAKIKLAAHGLSVDLSGLTDAAPYIQVKTGSKRVAGFTGKGANTYAQGSGGGSSDEIFGSNFS